MTDLPGSRPVITLYLDPAVALRPDGSLARFWGRFLVSFTRTFAQRHHAVVLDMGPTPDPAAAVDAQSYVVAGARTHYAVDPQELPFGQLLIAPDVHPMFVPDVSFAHDYPAIAHDIMAMLPDTQEILLIGRSGDFSYVDRIAAALAEVVPVREVSLADAAAAVTGQTVVSFHPVQHEVAHVAASLPPGVGMVDQSEPWPDDRGIVFLDLMGTECGAAVANGVGDALAGHEVGAVTLPHRLVTWSGPPPPRNTGGSPPDSP